MMAHVARRPDKVLSRLGAFSAPGVPAHVLESNFLRYNLTAFNRFPFGIYLDSVKPLGRKCEVLAPLLAASSTPT